MIVFLVPLLGLVAVFGLAALHDRAARRRRSRSRAGAEVQCRARLREGDGRGRRGRLVLSGPAVVWRGADGRTIDLAGADVVTAVTDPAWFLARLDDVELQMLLAGGGTAAVLLHQTDARSLINRLRDDTVPPPARPAQAALPDVAALPDGAEVPERGWLRAVGRAWPYGLLAVSAIWWGLWTWMVLAGTTVDAAVIGGDGETYCLVRWSDDTGQVQTSDVDCAGEPVGATKRIWALAAPQSGEAMDPGWTVGLVSASGLIVAGAGGAGLLLRRRPPGADLPLEVSVDPLSPLRRLPELTEQDVRPSMEPASAVLARFAPYAARQLPADGWEEPGERGGATTGSSPWRWGRALLAPAVALFCLTMVTGPWPYRWYALHAGPTATATAISTGEEILPEIGPVPADVAVRFRDPTGLQQQAEVATTRALPAGTVVTVRYALDRPGRARLVGAGDGLDRAAAAAGLVTVVILSWAGWRLVGVAAGDRAVRRAAAGPRRPGLALLTADPDGEPLLLACDPVLHPVRLIGVPLRTPLPHGTLTAFGATAGTDITLLGRPADGEAVITELPTGNRLLPAAPAYDLDPPLLLEVLDSAGVLGRDD